MPKKIYRTGRLESAERDLILKLNEKKIPYDEFKKTQSTMQDEGGTWHDIGRRASNPRERPLPPGRQAVVRDGQDLLAMPLADIGRRENVLQPVWQDGHLLKDWGFEEIRTRADAAMHW